MKSLISTNFSIAAKLSNTCRYIDDLLTLNNLHFHTYIGQIYPPESELKEPAESWSVLWGVQSAPCSAAPVAFISWTEACSNRCCSCIAFTYSSYTPGLESTNTACPVIPLFQCMYCLYLPSELALCSVLIALPIIVLAWPKKERKKKGFACLVICLVIWWCSPAILIVLHVIHEYYTVTGIGSCGPHVCRVNIPNTLVFPGPAYLLDILLPYITACGFMLCYTILYLFCARLQYYLLFSSCSGFGALSRGRDKVVDAIRLLDL